MSNFESSAEVIYLFSELYGNRKSLSSYILKKLDFCTVDGHCIFVLHIHHVMPFHNARRLFCLQTRCLFLFTNAMPFLFTTATPLFFLQMRLKFNTVTITIMNNVSETSIERRRRLKREFNARTKANQTSEQSGPHKGKKENQGLENLHAKQLLHLLSLYLLLMILTL